MKIGMKNWANKVLENQDLKVKKYDFDSSKDIPISQNPLISVQSHLSKPTNNNKTQKVTTLIYYHDGACYFDFERETQMHFYA